MASALSSCFKDNLDNWHITTTINNNNNNNWKTINTINNVSSMNLSIVIQCVNNSHSKIRGGWGALMLLGACQSMCILLLRRSAPPPLS